VPSRARGKGELSELPTFLADALAIVDDADRSSTPAVLRRARQAGERGRRSPLDRHFAFIARASI
jgi:hypothetical protein